jgi:glycosyltransferase involved in cell wall biosynthesis
MRLLSLKNPVRELRGYLKSFKTPFVKLFGKEPDNSRFHSFSYSATLREQKVSVIIPTLNRYIYLKDVLEDLEKQDHQNFDVIIVDQSEPFNKEFYQRFRLNLKVIEQKEKLLWTARNRAIKESDAGFLLFFDDDSRVKPDWITNHLKCIYAYDCDVSAGVSLSSYDKIQDSYKLFRFADQFDSGNALVKRDVFRKVGLFDEQYNKQRMGDGEFGYRIYLAGLKSVSNPLAERLHLKVGEGGLRQMGSWDGFRPKKITAPRPVPSVIYLYRTYFKRSNVFFILLLAVPRSVIPYKYRKDKVKLVLGTAGAFLLFPVILFQVYRSWRIAGGMLKQGSKIEKIS